MIVNYHELKDYGRCNIRRASKNLITVPSARTATEYTEAISLLKSLLHYKVNYKYLKKEEVEAAVENAFENLPFETEQTRKQKVKEAQICLKRYIYSEKRPYEFATAVKELELSSELEVSVVEPDLIFRTGNTIEVVKFSYTKPTITRTGKKMDYSVYSSLQLYALHKYGRLLRKGNEDIVASIYFLKRKNDDFKVWRYEPDFFASRDSSIISLEGDDNSIDIEFAKHLRTYVEGTICSGDQCKNCTYADLCSTKQLPPKALEEAVKEVKEIKLTEQQEKIVNFKEGIARVNACAGSGKTFVNMIRILKLIKEGANPDKILCITFTNSGAKELAERIKLYAPAMGVDVKEAAKVISTTFNSFGNDIVKENYDRLGFTRKPDTIDDVQSSAVLIEILRDNVVRGLEHLYANPFMSLPYAKGILILVKDVIDQVKAKVEYNETIVEPEIQNVLFDKYSSNLKNNSINDTVADLKNVYMLYNQKLKDLCLIDYNDQESILKYIAEYYPTLIEEKGLEHIVIDEAQDSNPRQIAIIKSMINCPTFKSLLFVGDDAQAIFAFRGATSYNLINFFKLLGKKGEDFNLTENFRSTNEITSVANDIVNMNTNGFTKLMTGKRDNPNNIEPQYLLTFTLYETVAKMIEAKIDAGVKPNDIAFIAMKNSELQKMAEQLSSHNIPYITINPEPMLKNRYVVSGIHYLRFFKELDQYDATIYLNGKIDNFSEKSEAEREFIFDDLLANTSDLREEYYNTNDSSCILKVLEELSNDEIYMEFFDKIKDLFERDNKNIEEVCEYLATLQKYGENKTVRRKGKYEGVVLTTAHSSKGLEWPIVFNSIENYASGVKIKPEDRDEEQEEALEEARRLAFVSFTRAQEELYILANSRNALVADVETLF